MELGLGLGLGLGVGVGVSGVGLGDGGGEPPGAKATPRKALFVPALAIVVTLPEIVAL